MSQTYHFFFESSVFTTLRSISQSLLQPFVDFVFPAVCLSCDEMLAAGEARICSVCWNSIARLDRHHPLFLDTKSRMTRGEAVSDLVACYVFEKEGAFQRIAHELKYGGFESLGVDLGQRIGAVMKEWNIRPDILIPIPLHKRKFRERGYNQAEAIGRGISIATGIPLEPGIVQRTRFTQTQTKLDANQRKANTEGAFELRRESTALLKESIVMLVDDVITTGATIESCARTLKQAGARRVLACSAALASRDVT